MLMTQFNPIAADPDTLDGKLILKGIRILALTLLTD